MNKISSTLALLLRHSKRAEDNDWSAIAQALAPSFFADMSLVDVVSIVVGAYEEALFEPRFEISRSGMAARDLLLAPIKGSCSVDFLGPGNLGVQYSVEQFYNAFLKHIMSELRLSRVDWCPEVFAGM